jgi:hypothetical protein
MLLLSLFAYFLRQEPAGLSEALRENGRFNPKSDRFLVSGNSGEPLIISFEGHIELLLSRAGKARDVAEYRAFY